MSWWHKLFGDEERPSSPPRAPAIDTTTNHEQQQTAVQSDTYSEAIRRVLSYGTASGPTEEEVLGLTEQVLQSPRQLELISAVALTYDSMPQSILRLVARAAAERGKPELAADFLQKSTMPADLLMRADFLYTSNRRREALETVERVLSLDIDTPGARERHERWRSELAPTLSTPPVIVPVPSSLHSPPAQQTPFMIVREAARGGAAVIFEATDSLLQRTVALKVYHRPEQDAEQLRREAVQATKFAGPGVIPVYDFNDHQGWIALGWCAGGSLAEIVAGKNPVDGSLLLRWLYELASTLTRIHDSGAVHGDLKPSNVLFTNSNQAVLADFGLCFPTGAPNPGGSAGFLSPERLAGTPLREDDDVFAFGCLIQRVLSQTVVTGNTKPISALADSCRQPRGRRPTSAKRLVDWLRPLVK